MLKLKFSGRGLAFISHFIARNDIRYYLNGVQFIPLPADAGGGVLGVATNGHALGAWHDKDGHVDRDVIATIGKPLIAACRKPLVMLENCDGRLAAVKYVPSKAGLGEEIYMQPNGISAPRGGVEKWEIEAKFPNVFAVMQSPENYRTDVNIKRVNSHLLGLLIKAVADASTNKRGYDGLMLRQRQSGDGIMALVETMPEAVAILMPMSGADEFRSPWLSRWMAHDARHRAAVDAPLPAMPSDAAPPPDFKRISTTTGSYPA